MLNPREFFSDATSMPRKGLPCIHAFGTRDRLEDRHTSYEH
jgi:hypothetical protein